MRALVLAAVLLTAAPAFAAAPRLKPYTVRADEMPGLAPDDKPIVIDTAARLAKLYEKQGAAAERFVRRLDTAGFAGFRFQHLAGKDRQEGLSSVFAFGSGADARAMGRRLYRQSLQRNAGRPPRRLEFSAGGNAWVQVTPGRSGAANVWIARGSCLVQLGDFSGRSATRAELAGKLEAGYAAIAERTEPCR